MRQVRRPGLPGADKKDIQNKYINKQMINCSKDIRPRDEKRKSDRSWQTWIKIDRLMNNKL